jgi:oxygen-independent coproporphyrinogen-3 oxidase
LEQEIERRGDWGPFTTVYVGGGSPSLLDEAGIERLVAAVRRGLSIDAGAEVTLEVNPADVTRHRARHWRELGFQRVSLGVQSLLDAELRWMGRRHDASGAVEAVAELRAGGFGNVGVDLVQGLPGQSVTERLESVRGVVELQPEHVSCYELTVEPSTPLHEAITRGRCHLPDSDAAADGYLATAELLTQHGYDHYEVSNYARSEVLASRHNRGYWRSAPYLGLGPSAHSFDGDWRFRNVASVAEYCRALESNGSAVIHRERLTEAQRHYERVALGVRTSEGIGAADVGDPEAIGELVAEGLLVAHQDRWVPTIRGFLVADAVARRILFGGAVTEGARLVTSAARS